MILKTAREQAASSRQRVLASLNWDGRYGVALLAVCGLLLLVQACTGAAGGQLLRYERAGLASGELWRLVTAHFIHLDLEHAVLNTLGITLMWALFARDYRPRQWVSIVAGSIIAIDAGLWLCSSTVRWYVGSSGALHGVMAAGTYAHLRRRDLDGWLLCAFLIGKLAYEQLAGALPFYVSSAGAVIVDAHLYGALGGLAVALTMRPASIPLNPSQESL
jgi:rhomboid family GlyGly-CTERM serine protease